MGINQAGISSEHTYPPGRVLATSSILIPILTSPAKPLTPPTLHWYVRVVGLVNILLPWHILWVYILD